MSEALPDVIYVISNGSSDRRIYKSERTLKASYTGPTPVHVYRRVLVSEPPMTPREFYNLSADQRVKEREAVVNRAVAVAASNQSGGTDSPKTTWRWRTLFT